MITAESPRWRLSVAQDANLTATASLLTDGRIRLAISNGNTGHVTLEDLEASVRNGTYAYLYPCDESGRRITPPSDEEFATAARAVFVTNKEAAEALAEVEELRKKLDAARRSSAAKNSAAERAKAVLADLVG